MWKGKKVTHSKTVRESSHGSLHSLATDCLTGLTHARAPMGQTETSEEKQGERARNGQAKAVRITSPPRLFPPGPWQKSVRRSKDECLSCVWEVWFRRWERAAKVTWKEENSVHLSLWLGMQGWRDQQGSALQASLEPGKHYWITRASISCRTTFLNSGLQCHLRTAPCVLFPSYGVSFTKSKLSHTFRLFSGNLIWCLIPLFHSQIITSSPSFYQKIPAPWKLILSNQSSLP